MEEQFEQFQKGFQSWLEAGQRLAEPALRGSEAAVRGMGQLMEDQIVFGRACADVYQQQLKSLADADNATTARRDTGALAAYRDAASQYGEAVRANADTMRERMTTIGREAVDTFTGVTEEWYRTAAAQGESAYKQTAAAVSEAAEKATAK